jgi:hypothetical protein
LCTPAPGMPMSSVGACARMRRPWPLARAA